jgi:transcriptional/translational regulatory protein YebC/TACO1
VHKKIEMAGIKIDFAEMTSLPTITAPLADANSIAAVNKMIDALEEHDDVKEVFSNVEFSEEVAA